MHVKIIFPLTILIFVIQNISLSQNYNLVDSIPTITQVKNFDLPISNYDFELEEEPIYKILFIGDFHQNIIVDSLCKNTFAGEKNFINYYHKTNEYFYPQDDEIEIIVDTLQIIQEHNYSTNTVIEKHPIFIKNLSKKPLKIGQGNRVNLRILRKQHLNDWNLIHQKVNWYYCGTGLNDVIIYPNQIAILSGAVKSQNQKDKFLYVLKFNNVISSNSY